MTQLIPGGLGRKLKPEDVAEDTRYYTELKRMEAKKAVMALGIAMLEKAQQLGLFSGPAGSGGSGGGGKPSPKGGPYIGPRGGKWADAQHTIPWKEHVSVARASAPDVLDDGVKFGAKLSEGVDVRASDRNLYITADKGKRDNILNVRKQVLEYLRKKYPGRSFAAAKSGGYQLWWTRVGGNADRLRAGIRISVTPEEQHALVMGGWRGLSGKPVAEQQADVVAGQSVKLEHIEHKPEKPGRGVKAARGQVFSSLETHPSDWAALEPSGFSEEEKTKKVMPTYHFPEGYKQPDTEMSAQGGEACQICGTNIKNVFWIAHHQKKLMLAVGSECVNKYAEAHMPHAAEALKRITSIKVKPEEVDHVNRLMTAGKPMDVAVARARARSAALKKYDKDNPSGNPDERERAVIKKEIAAAVKTDPEVVQWTKILAQHTAAKKTFFETDPAKKNPPVSGDQWEQVRRSAADLHIREKSDVKALQQLILSAEGNAKGRAEDEMGLKRTGWKAQNARVDLAGIEANAANMKYVSEHVREKAQADLESRIRGAVRYSLPHLGQQEQRDWIAKIPALVQHVSGKSQQSAMVGTRESIMKKSMTTESGKKITFKQLEAKIRASGGAGNPAAVAAKVYRESGADPAEEKKKKHRKEAAKSALVERGMALMKAGAGEGSRGGKVIGHTAGGKPIYEMHEESAKKHEDRARGARSLGSGFSASSSALANERAAKAHRAAAEAHRNGAKNAGQLSVSAHTASRNADSTSGGSSHHDKAEHHLNQSRYHNDDARFSTAAGYDAGDAHRRAHEAHKRAAETGDPEHARQAEMASHAAEHATTMANHSYRLQEHAQEATNHTKAEDFHRKLAEKNEQDARRLLAKNPSSPKGKKAKFRAEQHRGAATSHLQASVTHWDAKKDLSEWAKPGSDYPQKAAAESNSVAAHERSKGAYDQSAKMGLSPGDLHSGEKSDPEPTLVKGGDLQPLAKGYYPGPGSNITEWSNQFYDSPYGVDALKLLKEQASLKREEEEMEKRRKDYSELDAMPKGERDATRKRQRADEESLSEKRRTIAAKMATLEEKLLDHRIQQEEIKAKMGKSRRPTWPDGRYLTKNKLHEPLPHLLKGEAGMEVPEDVFARTSIEMTPNIVDGYALLNYPGSTPETQREKVSALFGEETPVEVDEHGNIPDVKGPFGSSY